MASTSDLKNGLVIKFRNELFTVIEFQHVKPGKGGAFVRTKLKNVKSGRVIDNTFRSGEGIDVVRIESKEMQYLYQEGDHFVFMDNQTYEQVYVSATLIGEGQKYLKEGESCGISFHGDDPITCEMPNFIILQVAETGPGAKGDTASGGSKPAKLETGAVVNVPFFINEGDMIRVDTRTNAYMERIKA
ncbi:elongation factor P [candidate division LCP-89 bacterium B3_LCP]|uniref:Elongation factor P n=1 Tax=candidate division LCP-89 bacterium B3_LCP TaxID=2012998 RepID=A0A532V3T7_UNCL8|nr:MAG: elongation factor P [candidate division LCP-89 bacterium B3_LCP]